MFQSVVGAMPMQGEMDMSYTVDGQAVAMTPSKMQAARDSGEITPMDQVNFGAMTEAEMNLAMDTAIPQNLTPEEMDRYMATKREAQEKMFALGGGMTDAQKRMMQEEEFQRMIMQENEMKQRAMDQRMMGDINSGVRPPARPMTSSPRPMPRPMR